MKILIFGKGYIANKFKIFFGEEAEISNVRIEDFSKVKAELEVKKPDVVLNCASGCVYEGDKGGEGYSEEDAPNFDGSYYSRTKAWSEHMLKDFNVLQLRLRMPFDSIPSERNFITKIVKYNKVISVPNSISVLEDFLKAAKVLIEKRATGVYNVTNPGTITHQEILDLYIELVDPTYHYELFSIEEMEKITKAKRSNCGLSVKKLEAEGIHLRPVAEAVRESLIEYQKNME
ncbi:MAG: hypothetical protein UY05_C0075G0007 [Candidatus Peregrinibacteria bacterium GW2011_GWA2_47_7]|nr:MAG: hypothetical protein UY05_C0075G0007 [Candidatus Peregrinibacteria bacterium GW2011_GWA2_47_7]